MSKEISDARARRIIEQLIARFQNEIAAAMREVDVISDKLSADLHRILQKNNINPKSLSGPIGGMIADLELDQVMQQKALHVLLSHLEAPSRKIAKEITTRNKRRAFITLKEYIDGVRKSAPKEIEPFHKIRPAVGEKTEYVRDVKKWVRMKLGIYMRNDLDRELSKVAKRVEEVSKRAIRQSTMTTSSNKFLIKNKQEHHISSAAQAIASSLKVESSVRSFMKDVESGQEEYIHCEIGIGNIHNLDRAGHVLVKHNGKRLPLWMILEYGTLNQFSLSESPNDTNFSDKFSQGLHTPTQLHIGKQSFTFGGMTRKRGPLPSGQVRVSDELKRRLTARVKTISESGFYPVYYKQWNKKTKEVELKMSFLRRDDISNSIRGNVNWDYNGFKGMHFISVGYNYASSKAKTVIFKVIEKCIKKVLDEARSKDINDIRAELLQAGRI